MMQEPWFTLIFVVLPLLVGAFNKFYLARGKERQEYTLLNHVLDTFLTVMILIYTIVSLMRI